MAVTNGGDSALPAGSGTLPPVAAQTSDESLMARVQAGDESALRLLMDRHAKSVFAVIHWLVGDRDWAESLSQDVFAAVFLRASSFKADRKFVPWLYAMARHAAVDHRRRRRFETEASRSLRPDRGAPPPPLGLEARELAAAAGRALESLPEKFRLPIVLCEIEGMSYDAAAAAIGCSEKTLSTRLTRARQKLRRSLERYEKP